MMRAVNMTKKWLIIIVVIGVVILGGAAFSFYWLWRTTPEMAFVPVQAAENEVKSIPFAQWIAEFDQRVAAEKAKAQTSFSLFLAGDVMLSRNVEATMLQKNDFSYCFVDMRKLVSGADLAFANLESPIVAGDPVPTGSFSFRANPKSAESLQLAGFDVLGLTNNHFGNFGREGMKATFDYLTDKGIDYVGAGKNIFEMKNPVIRQVKDTKVAFLAYGYGPDNYASTTRQAGMALMNDEQLVKDLKTAKEQADVVIVSMHDGIEYVNEPNDSQKHFAHLAIDNGADLVVGHHPHVVQQMEVYNGRYIFYSLGNLVFDQMWSEDTREGLSLVINFNKNVVDSIDYYPTVIENYCRPRLATQEESVKILDKLGPVYYSSQNVKGE
jgi:poly-gamma-glutamate synthesis protein (capsule biosynthesis protein)